MAASGAASGSRLTKTNGPQVSTRTGMQAVAGLVEVLHALELRRGHQLAVEGIGPAVVAALQRLAVALARGHVARAVAADVVEGAQRAVGASRDHQRLAQHFAGEEVAHAGHLVDAAHRLPGAGEDLLFLQRQERRLDVPARRHSSGAGQVRLELKVASNRPWLAPRVMKSLTCGDRRGQHALSPLSF